MFFALIKITFQNADQPKKMKRKLVQIFQRTNENLYGLDKRNNKNKEK